jgi:hypothetical protein
MSKLFNARQICERALRLIGAYSLMDSQADAEEMTEALSWLDIILAELSGTQRVYWLVPETLTMPLTASTASYDVLNTVTKPPTNGIEFPIEAWLSDAAGNRSEVELCTHRAFNEVAGSPATGLPTHIHIDRLGKPTIRVYPTPGADLGANEQFIKLVVQTYAGDFATGNGQKETGLRAAWQRWCIYELAANIGAGPVRRLGEREIAQIQQQAAKSLTALNGYENQQHTGQPQISDFRDF